MDHYRKIWRFRAPVLYRGSTHGIDNYAVSRPAQRTANTNRTANINETHGKISTQGTLLSKLTANENTRQNLQKNTRLTNTHGKLVAWSHIRGQSDGAA
jgi:hypothetical protein